MTSYGYIIIIKVDSCMIWFHFDCIMLLKKNHIILLLMFVTEKVQLLLVISLTVKGLTQKALGLSRHLMVMVKV